MTDHNSRVRTAILDHALRGRPVTISSLAAATGLARDGVKSVLTILHEAGAVHLRDGAVVAAYPFSLVPTAHRVTIGGVTAYAICAIDALAVPPMAGGAARITSTCGDCRGPITVTMQAHRVLESQPAAPVVFYLAKDCCAPGPAVLTRCPHIQFFCHRDHAARWQEAHPDHHGTVLDLADAAAFASRHFAEVIRAVRSDNNALTTLANTIAGAMPALGLEEQRLAVALYRALAEGTPVTPTRLAETLGVSKSAVHHTLLQWPGVNYDDSGAVIGFWGLALVDMPHRLRVNGRTLYTWCAWDSLFIPEILGTTAQVESADPVTHHTISLTVRPDGSPRWTRRKRSSRFWRLMRPSA